MGESPERRPNPAQGDRSHATRPSADELREQQAIAAALLIGEQLRQEDRKQVRWLAKRLGAFVAVMSLFGLLILFAYSRMREEYSPTVWMLILGAVGAAGIVATYWAYTGDRRD